MAEKKQYLDYEGLSLYDVKIKELFKSGDEAVKSAILQLLEDEYTAKSDMTWGTLGQN